MGCRKDKTNNCVADVVRAIADAQDDVIDNTCRVSCEKSINNLLGPVNRNDLDTVPFILYCEGNCKPFKGTGVRVDNMKFECIESFVFRVKEVDHDNCAVLQLLAFDGEVVEDDAGEDLPVDFEPCDQIDGADLLDLVDTGICITVDLDCFCAITCLPAVDLF